MKQLIVLAACVTALYGQPAYTLRLEEFTATHEGAPMRIAQTIVIAQRADGSRAEIRTRHLKNLEPICERTIIEASGRHIVISDDVGLRTTGAPWPAGMAEKTRLAKPTPASNCMTNGAGQPAHMGYRILGLEMVGGLRTVKMANEHMQAWHALDLECQEIQRLAGSAPFWNELRFVSYTPGDPEASLFEVASLRETPGKERLLRMFRKAGLSEEDLAKIEASWKADEARQR